MIIEEHHYTFVYNDTYKGARVGGCVCVCLFLKMRKPATKRCIAPACFLDPVFEPLPHAQFVPHQLHFTKQAPTPQAIAHRVRW